MQWRPGDWQIAMKVGSGILVLGYFTAALRNVYCVHWLRALVSSVAAIAFFFYVGSIYVYRSLQFLLVYAIT
jgi:hypothetical protein